MRNGTGRFDKGIFAFYHHKEGDLTLSLMENNVVALRGQRRSLVAVYVQASDSELKAAF